MNTLRRLLPSSLFNAILQPTFYRQFVAGNDITSITTTTTRLAAVGIRPMIAVPIEVTRQHVTICSDEIVIQVHNYYSSTVCLLSKDFENEEVLISDFYRMTVRKAMTKTTS